MEIKVNQRVKHGVLDCKTMVTSEKHFLGKL